MTKDELKKALRKAYNYGQMYFSQADSEQRGNWKRAEETAKKFEEFVEVMCETLEAE